jgi:hypothetical protein
MPADPFTIRIFVPDGDPEGVRIIDRMNWTGLGIVFPRSKWLEVKQRAEFTRTGVYILVGYKSEGDDLPTIYIGQADGVRNRIESHAQNKDFWDWGIAFVSTSGGLNRAHVTWLEYALIRRATQTKHCNLENGNAPQEPALTEAEKADTQGFLKEILQILPHQTSACKGPRHSLLPIIAVELGNSACSASECSTRKAPLSSHANTVRPRPIGCPPTAACHCHSPTNAANCASAGFGWDVCGLA